MRYILLYSVILILTITFGGCSTKKKGTDTCAYQEGWEYSRNQAIDKSTKPDISLKRKWRNRDRKANPDKVSVFIKVNKESSRGRVVIFLEKLGANIKSDAGEIVIADIDIDDLPSIVKRKDIIAIEMAQEVKLK